MTPYGSRTILTAFGICAVLCILAGCSNQSDIAADGIMPATSGETASEWPIITQVGGGTVTLYQPQLEKFANARFSGRMAVAVQLDGRPQQAYGTAWIDSMTMCDRDARVVTLTDVKVVKVLFPEAPETDQKALDESARGAMQDTSMKLSWDAMLEMMKAARIDDPDEGIGTAPPQIIFRDHPAVLVQYDGLPQLLSIQGSSLMRAANTPYFVIMDPSTKDCYLKVAGKWFRAKDPLGPFADAINVPDEMRTLADKYGYQNPAASQETAAVVKEGVEIVTTTEPAELVYTDGAPLMGAIPGTNLLYVTNTDSDVFQDSVTQQKYILISGRWYTASASSGPWTYVPADRLPEEFKMIPPGSPKGHVLASVAGTDAAQTAVLDAQVPQTAMIDRKSAQKPAVDYDGQPDFQPVAGTSVYYAPNTSYSVLRVGDLYYCCYNAVWYVSSSPYGPWELCTSVPPDIYTIPPTCPIYPVRYCYIYDYTPNYIYCGYTPGYTGCYILGPTVVFGTGYWNHCWYGHRYYARPCTFGFGAFFDPFACQWSFTCGLDFPISFFGRNIREDRSQHWGGGGWWGFGGFHHADVHVDASLGIQHDRFDVFTRRTDVRARVPGRPLMGVGAAGRTTSAFEQRGNASGGFEAGRMGVTEPGRGGISVTQPARPMEDMRNNVLSDPQGNVHRMTLDGWQSRQGHTWVPSQQRPQAESRPAQQEQRVQQPTERVQQTERVQPQQQSFESSRPQLDSEFRARVAAPQRQSTWSHSSYSESRSDSTSATESRGGRGGGGGERRH